MSRFKKAVRTRRKLRMTLFGPSGSGKTRTALEIASALGKKVLVVDTEYGSASLYSDRFEFDTCDVTDHDLRGYVTLLKDAAAEGYDVVVIDSLSHAWIGAGGELEMADAASSKYRGNTHAAWKDVRPHERRLLDAMLGYPGHIIATMRSKTAYEVQKDDRGKATPKKIGLAPVQKEGLEYEFDLIGEIDIDHTLVVTKTRFDGLDGLIVTKPGHDFAAKIAAELETGQAPPPAETVSADTTPAPAPALRPFGEFLAAAATHGGCSIADLVADAVTSLIEDGKIEPGIRDHHAGVHILAGLYEDEATRPHAKKLVSDLAKHYRENAAIAFAN